MAKIVKFKDGKYGYRRTSMWAPFAIDHYFLTDWVHPVWKIVDTTSEVPEICKFNCLEDLERAIQRKSKIDYDSWSKKDHGKGHNTFWSAVKSLIK